MQKHNMSLVLKGTRRTQANLDACYEAAKGSNKIMKRQRLNKNETVKKKIHRLG